MDTKKLDATAAAIGIGSVGVLVVGAAAASGPLLIGAVVGSGVALASTLVSRFRRKSPTTKRPAPPPAERRFAKS